MGATLDATLADVLAWQRATFGAPSLPGNLRKLRGEVGELCDALAGIECVDPSADTFDGIGSRICPPPGCAQCSQIHGPALAELADVIIMAAGVTDALGLTLGAVAEAVAAKLEINRARTWRKGADGTWSHVKGETK